MEMAKPEKIESELPAFATPTPKLSSVEDLERRLRMIENSPDPASAVTATKPAPQAKAPPPTAASGKTALLVSHVKRSFCYFTGNVTTNKTH